MSFLATMIQSPVNVAFDLYAMADQMVQYHNVEPILDEDNEYQASPERYEKRLPARLGRSIDIGLGAYRMERARWSEKGFDGSVLAIGAGVLTGAMMGAASFFEGADRFQEELKHAHQRTKTAAFRLAMTDLAQRIQPDDPANTSIAVSRIRTVAPLLKYEREFPENGKRIRYHLGMRGFEQDGITYNAHLLERLDRFISLNSELLSRLCGITEGHDDMLNIKPVRGLNQIEISIFHKNSSISYHFDFDRRASESKARQICDDVAKVVLEKLKEDIKQEMLRVGQELVRARNNPFNPRILSTTRGIALIATIQGETKVVAQWADDEVQNAYLATRREISRVVDGLHRMSSEVTALDRVIRYDIASTNLYYRVEISNQGQPKLVIFCASSWQDDLWTHEYEYDPTLQSLHLPNIWKQDDNDQSAKQFRQQVRVTSSGFIIRVNAGTERFGPTTDLNELYYRWLAFQQEQDELV